MLEAYIYRIIKIYFNLCTDNLFLYENRYYLQYSNIKYFNNQALNENNGIIKLDGIIG